jgi:lysophospholipase L1-like esterase
MVLASIAITLAGVLVAGEISMRYYERHRSSVPGTMSSLFYPHLRLRYALVRNMDYYGWAHTNAQGMRGPAVPVVRTPGVPRIMIVGGSTTFDSFVRGDDETWPAQLQAQLTQLRGGHAVEVINAGVPGYRLVDNIIRLQTELYRLRPDVIVFYESHNDIFNAFHLGVDGPQRTNTPDEMPVVTPWRRWLERHSLLYDKVLSRFLAVNFQRVSRAEMPRAATGDSLLRATLDSGVASFDRDLTSFVLIAQSLGARVVIPEVVHVTGPRVEAEPNPKIRNLWSASVPFAPPEMILRAYVRYDDVARAVASKRGATYIPTVGFGLVGPRWYSPGDPIHFNTAGAERMGQSMARALVAAGIVDTTAVPVARVVARR